LAGFFVFIPFICITSIILFSDSSKISYIGYNEDPWDRLSQHNNKEEETFSSKHKPWELKAVFETSSKADAISIERFIKKQKSKKLIAKLIDPTFIPEGKLALPIAIGMVRVPHLRD
jgi:putative endonuclease